MVKQRMARRAALAIVLLMTGVASIWLVPSEAAGEDASSRPEQALSLLERRPTDEDRIHGDARRAALDVGVREETVRLLAREDEEAYYAGVDRADNVCLVANLSVDLGEVTEAPEPMAVSSCESVPAFTSRGVDVGVHVEGRGGRVLVLLPDDIEHTAEQGKHRRAIRDNLVTYVHDQAGLREQDNRERLIRMTRYEATGRQGTVHLVLPAGSRRVR